MIDEATLGTTELPVRCWEAEKVRTGGLPLRNFTRPMTTRQPSEQRNFRCDFQYLPKADLPRRGARCDIFVRSRRRCIGALVLKRCLLVYFKLYVHAYESVITCRAASCRLAYMLGRAS